jgi:hypothetical protein
MIYYSWILNIDDKKLHENTVEASEYIICKHSATGCYDTILEYVGFEVFTTSACHLLTCWFLLKLFLRPWRWRRYVPPKRRAPLNALHGVISQKKILFNIRMDLKSLVQSGIDFWIPEPNTSVRWETALSISLVVALWLNNLVLSLCTELRKYSHFVEICHLGPSYSTGPRILTRDVSCLSGTD